MAVSDVLTGAKMDIQPLAGDDFQSLLTVLPSIIRGPEGRLRIKGGAPTTGALQMSSASLNDPSTGDFDLELPSGAVESVEVLSNPFAAEYGRFSTSVTQVRTKRGTNDWIVQARQPDARVRQGVRVRQQVRAAAVDLRARSSATGCCSASTCSTGSRGRRCKSLPGEPQLGLDSFDSFTRLDAVLSSRHALTGGVIYFPRKITNADALDVPARRDDAEVHAGGIFAGAGRSADPVVATPCSSRRSPAASSRSIRRRQGDAADGLRAPDAERQLLQPPGAQRPQPAARRGADDLEGLGRPARVQGRRRPSAFRASTAISLSQQLDVVRLDGSLAERTTYSPSSDQPDVIGTEFAVFVQDRWRVNDRLMLRAGLPRRSRRRRRARELLAARRACR